MERLHPFKQIRETNNLSQNQVAYTCGLTQQVVLRTEQGLYGLPSVKLLNYLASLEESHPVAELTKLYKEWQTEHRKYNRIKVEFPLQNYRVENPNEKITLPQLKKILHCTSSIGLCKLICVHPSQIDRYTRYGGSLRFLEEALSDILSEDLAKWVVTHLRPS
jgi:transcriptional regulator with XRE-family HTH domain